MDGCRKSRKHQDGKEEVRVVRVGCLVCFCMLVALLWACPSRQARECEPCPCVAGFVCDEGKCVPSGQSAKQVCPAESPDSGGDSGVPEHVAEPKDQQCISQQEVCNGKDDDCDGQIDEGLTCPGKCPPPNVLIILDRSCSMAFTNAKDYITSSQPCSAIGDCTPMTPREHQPTPGLPPRYPALCTSGSCQYSRWDTAWNAMDAMVYAHGGTPAKNYEDHKLRFGLVEFSRTASVSAKIGSTPPEIAVALGRLVPSGASYNAPIFPTVLKHLTATVNADSAKKRKTHLLFLTDGDPADTCGDAAVRELYQGSGGFRLVDAQGQVHRVKTHVFGLGKLSSASHECLNKLAQAGGTSKAACDNALLDCVKYNRMSGGFGSKLSLELMITSLYVDPCR